MFPSLGQYRVGGAMFNQRHDRPNKPRRSGFGVGMSKLMRTVSTGPVVLGGINIQGAIHAS